MKAMLKDENGDKHSKWDMMILTTLFTTMSGNELTMFLENGKGLSRVMYILAIMLL
jgi:hypothetical protein